MGGPAEENGQRARLNATLLTTRPASQWVSQNGLNSPGFDSRAFGETGSRNISLPDQAVIRAGSLDLKGNRGAPNSTAGPLRSPKVRKSWGESGTGWRWSTPRRAKDTSVLAVRANQGLRQAALLSGERVILRETQRAVTPFGGVAVFIIHNVLAEDWFGSAGSFALESRAIGRLPRSPDLLRPKPCAWGLRGYLGGCVWRACARTIATCGVSVFADRSRRLRLRGEGQRRSNHVAGRQNRAVGSSGPDTDRK